MLGIKSLYKLNLFGPFVILKYELLVYGTSVNKIKIGLIYQVDVLYVHIIYMLRYSSQICCLIIIIIFSLCNSTREKIKYFSFSNIILYSWVNIQARLLVIFKRLSRIDHVRVRYLSSDLFREVYLFLENMFTFSRGYSRDIVLSVNKQSIISNLPLWPIL